MMMDGGTAIADHGFQLLPNAFTSSNNVRTLDAGGGDLEELLTNYNRVRDIHTSSFGSAIEAIAFQMNRQTTTTPQQETPTERKQTVSAENAGKKDDTDDATATTTMALLEHAIVFELTSSSNAATWMKGLNFTFELSKQAHAKEAIQTQVPLQAQLAILSAVLRIPIFYYSAMAGRLVFDPAKYRGEEEDPGESVANGIALRKQQQLAMHVAEAGDLRFYLTKLAVASYAGFRRNLSDTLHVKLDEIRSYFGGLKKRPELQSRLARAAEMITRWEHRITQRMSQLAAGEKFKVGFFGHNKIGKSFILNLLLLLTSVDEMTYESCFEKSDDQLDAMRTTGEDGSRPIIAERMDHKDKDRLREVLMQEPNYTETLRNYAKNEKQLQNVKEWLLPSHQNPAGTCTAFMINVRYGHRFHLKIEYLSEDEMKQLAFGYVDGLYRKPEHRNQADFFTARERWRLWVKPEAHPGVSLDDQLALDDQMYCSGVPNTWEEVEIRHDVLRLAGKRLVYVSSGKHFDMDRVWTREKLLDKMSHADIRYLIKQVTLYAPSSMLRAGCEWDDLPGSADADWLNTTTLQTKMMDLDLLLVLIPNAPNTEQSILETLTRPSNNFLRKMIESNKCASLAFLFYREQHNPLFLNNLHEDYVLEWEAGTVKKTSDMLMDMLEKEHAVVASRNNIQAKPEVFQNLCSSVEFRPIYPTLFASLLLGRDLYIAPTTGTDGNVSASKLSETMYDDVIERTNGYVLLGLIESHVRKVSRNILGQVMKDLREVAQETNALERHTSEVAVVSESTRAANGDIKEDDIAVVDEEGDNGVPQEVTSQLNTVLFAMQQNGVPEDDILDFAVNTNPTVPARALSIAAAASTQQKTKSSSSTSGGASSPLPTTTSLSERVQFLAQMFQRQEAHMSKPEVKAALTAMRDTSLSELHRGVEALWKTQSATLEDCIRNATLWFEKTCSLTERNRGVLLRSGNEAPLFFLNEIFEPISSMPWQQLVHSAIQDVFNKKSTAAGGSDSNRSMLQKRFAALHRIHIQGLFPHLQQNQLEHLETEMLGDSGRVCANQVEWFCFTEIEGRAKSGGASSSICLDEAHLQTWFEECKSAAFHRASQSFEARARLEAFRSKVHDSIRAIIGNAMEMFKQILKDALTSLHDKLFAELQRMATNAVRALATMAQNTDLLVGVTADTTRELFLNIQLNLREFEAHIRSLEIDLTASPKELGQIIADHLTRTRVARQLNARDGFVDTSDLGIVPSRRIALNCQEIPTADGGKFVHETCAGITAEIDRVPELVKTLKQHGLDLVRVHNELDGNSLFRALGDQVSPGTGSDDFYSRPVANANKIALRQRGFVSDIPNANNEYVPICSAGSGGTADFKRQIEHLGQCLCALRNSFRGGVVWCGVQEDGCVIGIDPFIRVTSSVTAAPIERAKMLQECIIGRLQPAPKLQEEWIVLDGDTKHKRAVLKIVVTGLWVNNPKMLATFDRVRYIRRQDKFQPMAIDEAIALATAGTESTEDEKKDDGGNKEMVSVADRMLASELQRVAEQQEVRSLHNQLRQMVSSSYLSVDTAKFGEYTELHSLLDVDERSFAAYASHLHALGYPGEFIDIIGFVRTFKIDVFLWVVGRATPFCFRYQTSRHSDRAVLLACVSCPPFVVGATKRRHIVFASVTRSATQPPVTSRPSQGFNSSSSSSSRHHVLSFPSSANRNATPHLLLSPRSNRDDAGEEYHHNYATRRFSTSCGIFVRELPPDCTLYDLESHFAMYGRVLDCLIPSRNRAGSLFALVEFEKPSQARSAIKDRRNHLMHGYQLRVHEYQERDKTTTSGSRRSKSTSSYRRRGDYVPPKNATYHFSSSHSSSFNTSPPPIPPPLLMVPPARFDTNTLKITVDNNKCAKRQGHRANSKRRRHSRERHRRKHHSSSRKRHSRSRSYTRRSDTVNRNRRHRKRSPSSSRRKYDHFRRRSPRRHLSRSLSPKTKRSPSFHAHKPVISKRRRSRRRDVSSSASRSVSKSRSRSSSSEAQAEKRNTNKRTQQQEQTTTKPDARQPSSSDEDESDPSHSPSSSKSPSPSKLRPSPSKLPPPKPKPIPKVAPVTIVSQTVPAPSNKTQRPVCVSKETTKPTSQPTRTLRSQTKQQPAASKATSTKQQPAASKTASLAENSTTEELSPEQDFDSILELHNANKTQIKPKQSSKPTDLTEEEEDDV